MRAECQGRLGGWRGAGDGGGDEVDGHMQSPMAWSEVNEGVNGWMEWAMMVWGKSERGRVASSQRARARAGARARGGPSQAGRPGLRRHNGDKCSAMFLVSDDQLQRVIEGSLLLILRFDNAVCRLPICRGECTMQPLCYNK